MDNRQRGFTIAEIILAIIVVGILAAMFVPRYTSLARIKHQVYSTAHAIAGDLRYAQRLAVSGGPTGNPVTTASLNENRIVYWFEMYKSAAGATDSWKIYRAGRRYNPEKATTALSDVVIFSASTYSFYFNSRGAPKPAAGGNILVRDTRGKYKWRVSVVRTGKIELTEE